MSIDTSVDGDPGSCRRTAQEAARPARPARRGPFVPRRPGPPRSCARFDGLSGDAYRGRCAAIGRTVDAAADSSRGLARALNEYADGLDEVIAVMARARNVARSELVLHGHTIPTPGGYATDRQRHVYRTVAASVAGCPTRGGPVARCVAERDRPATPSGRSADLCLPDVSTTPLPGRLAGAAASEARRRRSSRPSPASPALPRPPSTTTVAAARLGVGAVGRRRCVLTTSASACRSPGAAARRRPTASWSAPASTVLPGSGVPPELTLRCVAVDTDLDTWRAEAIGELADAARRLRRRGRRRVRAAGPGGGLPPVRAPARHGRCAERPVGVAVRRPRGGPHMLSGTRGLPRLLRRLRGDRGDGEHRSGAA